MLADGSVKGLDDPRLATLVALRRRGITSEALRTVTFEVGPRPVDATLSWENIYAINRKIIDPIANRYFFIHEPLELLVEGVSERITSRPLLNPNDQSRGYRTLQVTSKEHSARLLISRKDHEIVQRGFARLMELFNIEYIRSDEKTVRAKLHSIEYPEARRLGAPLIHWLPSEGNVKTEVMMPNATILSGFGEPMLASERPNSVVQLVRFGFGRIDEIKDDLVSIYYAHN
jgi:glutamyl-tRNA synthetase